MKFVLLFVLPALLAFYFFASAQSAFADAHGLYNVYCVAGWTLSAFVAAVAIYYFAKLYKRK